MAAEGCCRSPRAARTPVAIRPTASSASRPTQATGQCAAVAASGSPVASTDSQGSRTSPHTTSSHPARPTSREPAQPRPPPASTPAAGHGRAAERSPHTRRLPSRTPECVRPVVACSRSPSRVLFPYGLQPPSRAQASSVTQISDLGWRKVHPGPGHKRHGPAVASGFTVRACTSERGNGPLCGGCSRARAAPPRSTAPASLVVSDSAVAKHINSIFTKLDLPRADADHRRVLAVLRLLGVANA